MIINKKYTITGSIGLILTVLVIAGVTLHTADYRQLLQNNPNSTYVMINYDSKKIIEFITRGVSDFLRWKITDNSLTIYDASRIAAQSDWTVEYYRTYGVDTWIPLRRKSRLISYDFVNDTKSITVLKDTPYYKYYASGNGGDLVESFKVTGTAHYTDFPDIYSVEWDPDPSRQAYLHRLTWRVKELEPLPNTPSGNLTGISEISFGHHMKVSWKDSINQVDYAEYNPETETLLVHFLPLRGTQKVLVKAFDPIPTNTLIYLDSQAGRRYYEEGHNATFYVETFTYSHDEHYNSSVYNLTDNAFSTYIYADHYKRLQLDIPDKIYNCSLNFSVGYIENAPQHNLTLTFGDYTNTSVVTAAQAATWSMVTGPEIVVDIPDGTVFNTSQLNATLSCPLCNSSYSYTWERNHPTYNGGKSWKTLDGGETWTTVYDLLGILTCTKKDDIVAGVNVSMNHPVLGTNFTSGNTPLTYVWEDVNSSLQKFSDGTSTKEITKNTTIAYSLNLYDRVDDGFFSMYANKEVTDLKVYMGAEDELKLSLPKFRNSEVIYDANYFSNSNVSIFNFHGDNTMSIPIAANKTYTHGSINVTSYAGSPHILQTIFVDTDDLFSLAANAGYLYAGQINNISVSSLSNVYVYRIYDGLLIDTFQRCVQRPMELIFMRYGITQALVILWIKANCLYLLDLARFCRLE